jgi:hypothetical protein
MSESLKERLFYSSMALCLSDLSTAPRSLEAYRDCLIDTGATLDRPDLLEIVRFLEACVREHTRTEPEDDHVVF